ncbi:hypothetical protein AYI69_g3849 [Smittium culicis]|uniref:Uncharacterized protein n=1 Tax=Smittium culicis TaxID=133412 RepID=A0A1R1YIN4_9FUNG|nr:hypothetical protein AYI69_g3849 [Smittium culicis]
MKDHSFQRYSRYRRRCGRDQAADNENIDVGEAGAVQLQRQQKRACAEADGGRVQDDGCRMRPAQQRRAQSGRCKGEMGRHADAARQVPERYRLLLQLLLRVQNLHCADKHTDAQGWQHGSGDQHAGDCGKEFRCRETRRAVLDAAAQLPARRRNGDVLHQRPAPPLRRPHVNAPQHVQSRHTAFSPPAAAAPAIKQCTNDAHEFAHKVPRTDHPQFGQDRVQLLPAVVRRHLYLLRPHLVRRAVLRPPVESRQDSTKT